MSGVILVALAPHLLDHLACFRGGFVAVLGDPLMGGAVDVEVGDWHGRSVTIARADREAHHHVGLSNDTRLPSVAVREPEAAAQDATL